MRNPHHAPVNVSSMSLLGGSATGASDSYVTQVCDKHQARFELFVTEGIHTFSSFIYF